MYLAQRVIIPLQEKCTSFFGSNMTLISNVSTHSLLINEYSTTKMTCVLTSTLEDVAKNAPTPEMRVYIDHMSHEIKKSNIGLRAWCKNWKVFFVASSQFDKVKIRSIICSWHAQVWAWEKLDNFFYRINDIFCKK